MDDLREPRRLRGCGVRRPGQDQPACDRERPRDQQDRAEGRSPGVMTEILQLATRLPKVTRLGNRPGKASAKA